MARSPVLPRHIHRGLWLIFVPFVVALIFFALRWTFPSTPTVDYRLQQQTISNAQNQAKLQANHIATVGPPAAAISKGNATAVPTKDAPTTPAPTYTVGPTDAQVQAAVARYFRAHPVKAPVSAAQITQDAAAYVAAYLRTHPAPSGKRGATGPSGVPGSPGAEGSPGASGAAAPPPTDAQIAAAVQQYLPGAVAAYLIANPPASGPAGSPGPSGPSGAAGDPGPSGAPGRGVAHSSIQLQADGSCDLIETYTDGTTEDAGQIACPPQSSGTATP